VPVLGVTGGIATGKSTFNQTLLRRLPAEFFDADRAAHALLEGDAETRQAIEAAFGVGVYNAEGKPDRVRLRELVFADEQNRRQLEAILHPAIRRSWMARAEIARSTDSWLVIDIPLLYETGAESHFDRVVVVACSPATQRRRLDVYRHLAPEMAEQIIAAQLDLATKVRKADHLIWNDSSVSCLERQTDLLATWLRQTYG
jgi:dephospho-CoA kinase